MACGVLGAKIRFLSFLLMLIELAPNNAQHACNHCARVVYSSTHVQHVDTPLLLVTV